MTKTPCPLCGAMRMRSAIKRHLGSRPCRGQQVVNRMRERHGIVPVRAKAQCLEYAKVLRWANLPYERVPARPGSPYRNRTAWGYQLRLPLLPDDAVDLDDPIYRDLGDVLFVAPWIQAMLDGVSSTALYRIKKARFAPFVELLQKIKASGEEFQAAIITTAALGGQKAVKELLGVEEWILPRSRGG